jgi:LysM repeat protein
MPAMPVTAPSAQREPSAESDTPDIQADAPQGESPLTSRPAEPETVALPDVHPEPDWMDRVCPYLLSEDGTYRSSQPDASHRCMAQDPPGLLPTAFQERFCLTERHVRCEMYKVAQSARAAALGDEGVPVDQIRRPRFRPSVRSVPLALGPSTGATGDADTASRRPVILAAIGIAVVAIVIFLLVLVLGGGTGGGTGASPSPSAVATREPASPAPATATPSVAASAGLASPAASSDPLAGLVMAEYQVQEGEALLAIAERFGVTRRQILLANPGMAESKPYTEAGQVIVVPVSSEVSELLLAPSPPPGFEGFQGFLE